jgi:hypothetical protein
MQCPQCWHQNSTTAKFCEECGPRLARHYPVYSQAVRSQAKFYETVSRLSHLCPPHRCGRIYPTLLGRIAERHMFSMTTFQ